MRKLSAAVAAFFFAAAAANGQMTSPATASATVGTPFTYQIEPSNPASISFVIAGLPAGLSGNSAYGTISGTPTTAGTFPVTVGITSAGTYKQSTLTLTVNPAGTTTAPPAGPATPACATKPCVALSCTPSPQANATSTVTMMRAVGSAAPAQLATGLPNDCAYADTAVSAGNSYTYSAVAVVNGQQSGDSNSFAITIPAVALTTPTVSISFTPATATWATAVTATVTVSGAPAPSGSVTLTSGAFSSAATLANGSAAIIIPANSLDVGSISFTATYTPDAASATIYASATGTASISITPTPPTALAGSVAQ